MATVLDEGCRAILRGCTRALQAPKACLRRESPAEDPKAGARKQRMVLQGEVKGSKGTGKRGGKVSFKMLMVYVNAMGGKFRFLVLMSWFLLVELCRVGATVWLSYWTGITDRPGGAPHSALWAPLSFFHVTPTGRIINRLTKDTSDVDENLADFAAFFLRSCLQLTSTIILVGVTTPFALPFLIPILLLFYFLYQYFQASVREVKRLDSISRSPVYSSIGEVINGLPTIRAYRAEDRLSQRNCNLVDNSVVMSLINQSMNRWLSVRLETLGALAAFSAAVLAIEARGAASQMGLTLSYALQITSLTSMTVRLASVAENAFNAVERMAEYSKLKEEAPAVIPNSAPSDWPSAGKIEFKDVKMRYRPGLPLVLKGLNVCIEAGTTSGKTSVINTIFRLMELDQGGIYIDDVEVAKLGLAQLRNSMAIIPQVPVLFTGTMRSNLDPFERHNDMDIWAALRRAHLARVVESNPLGLEMTLAEGGAPLSAGQKQLILILDEATANVDVETDALIQKTVREEFKDRTIVAIAHRLHTIIDCDMVLVMDNGSAAEWGRPSTLLEDPNGTFSSMVKETGHAAEQFLRSVANGQADHRAERDQRAAAALQRVNTSPDWQTDCSAASTDLVEKSQAAQKLLKVVIAGLSEDAHSEEVRKQLGIDSFAGEGGSVDEHNTYQAMMQAADLLTDINKLAAQARRFLKTDSKPSSHASFSAPRSPTPSSHPGTPPPDYGGGGGSVTSPLLSPRRSTEEAERLQPPQSRGLSRNNSTGLGSRNLAGPFGAAAVQGMSGLQSYNSLPVPRPSRVSIDGRRRPLPNLDELLPSSSSRDLGSSGSQRWNKLHSQLKGKPGKQPSVADRHRLHGEDPSLSNDPEYR
ncbi:MAG: ABC transporter C family member 2-like [Trebouxia sp. A1-2]|nr:MAG: ABC transporter C family member 2-like [Trebouxia sp. A1-2]